MPSVIRAHLITLLLGENGYRVPVCEITKGKTMSPEQSTRGLWKCIIQYEKGLGR